MAQSGYVEVAVLPRFFVVKPGDTMVVSLPGSFSEAEADDLRRRLESKLPGVSVVPVAAYVEAVYRPGPAEEPGAQQGGHVQAVHLKGCDLKFAHDVPVQCEPRHPVYESLRADVMRRHGYDPSLPARGITTGTPPPGQRNWVCLLEGVTIDGHEDPGRVGMCIHCSEEMPR